MKHSYFKWISIKKISTKIIKSKRIEISTAKIMIDIADFPKYENSFDKNELTCPISYLDITNYIDKIICGTCKNVFEKKSLISWLKINFSCPLCKENSFFYL